VLSCMTCRGRGVLERTGETTRDERRSAVPRAPRKAPRERVARRSVATAAEEAVSRKDAPGGNVTITSVWRSVRKRLGELRGKVVEALR
jgi:hypothetical protein